MKFVFILFIIFPIVVIGQNVNPDILPKIKLTLSANGQQSPEIKLPFSGIRILDNRFDTSKLGFAPTFQIIKNKKKAGRKIIVEGGVQNSLEKYYNNVYQNSFSNSKLKLLIVLKKLWISSIDNSKSKEIDILRGSKFQSFLYCKLEYYINEGEKFYPFKRLDTVISDINSDTSDIRLSKYPSESEGLKLILNSLVENIDYNKVINNLQRIPEKSWSDIQIFNSAFYKIPVLNDSVIAKGVFLTFNEFRNNKPSVVNFAERVIYLKGGKTQNYIEDSNGNRISNYWGYNTGTSVKCSKFGNYELPRIGNTFECFGSYQQFEERASLLYGNVYKDIDNWMPYQLDMETGNIY